MPVRTFSIAGCDLSKGGCCCMDESHMLAALICYLTTTLQAEGGQNLTEWLTLFESLGGEKTLNEQDILCFETLIAKCLAEFVTGQTQVGPAAAANGDCKNIVNTYSPPTLRLIVIVLLFSIIEQLVNA